MAVTFQLCDVARAIAPLREMPLTRVVRDLLGTSVEACGGGVDSCVSVQQNAFLAAAWRAYADHRPLVLTPDAVWLCLAQGFAAHVNLHAEELRGRFVRHQGRAKLVVELPGFVKGSPDNPWPAVFHAFSEQIAGHIGRQRDLVVCDFSTTGAAERIASELVLMDAMQQYFEYEFVPICGIPEITLEGTVDDWKSVRQRAHMLAEYGLEWWTSVLLPVLDEFVAASDGRPDVAFWRHFFEDSHSDGCGGGPELHGWILLLFPYLTGGAHDGSLHRNDVVVRAYGALPVKQGGGAADWIIRARLHPECIPLGLSRAPLNWVELDGRTYPMDLIGGFMGIAQDPATLALRPAIGWAVRDHASEILVRWPCEGRVESLRRDAGDDARVDSPVVDEPLSRLDIVVEDDGIFLFTEWARCSRASTPVGRLILARTGLHFTPVTPHAGDVDNWLGRALSDDDDDSAGDSSTAASRSIDLDPPALAGLVLRPADGAREAVEIVVTLPTGEPVSFTIPDSPRDLTAWYAAMRAAS